MFLKKIVLHYCRQSENRTKLRIPVPLLLLELQDAVRIFYVGTDKVHVVIGTITNLIRRIQQVCLYRATNEMNEFWNRRTYVILTGASKGIGQCLAVQIGRLLIPDSTIVLMARDTIGLEKTKKMINEENNNILVEVSGLIRYILYIKSIFYFFP